MSRLSTKNTNLKINCCNRIKNCKVFVNILQSNETFTKLYNQFKFCPSITVTFFMSRYIFYSPLLSFYSFILSTFQTWNLKYFTWLFIKTHWSWNSNKKIDLIWFISCKLYSISITLYSYMKYLDYYYYSSKMWFLYYYFNTLYIVKNLTMKKGSTFFRCWYYNKYTHDLKFLNDHNKN